MNKHPLFFNGARWALAVTLAVAFSIPASAQNAGPQLFKDSLPAVVPHMTAKGRLAAETRMNLSIGLPLRNENALNNLLNQLYDPANPNYRHYLTPQQFVEQYAPSVSDYQTVASYFGTNGFTVVQHPDRMVLDVSGTAADVERVFRVTMGTYQHPKENRNFFAPDTVPSLNLSVPILHISGLDNYALKRSQLVKENAVKRSANAAGQAKPKDLTGSGPSGGFMGNDFRAAYMPGVSLTGTNQTVGLLEFDTYYPSDITTYEGFAGVSVPLKNVSVDGGATNTPGSGNDEVCLDIEVAMSVAPRLDQIVIYEAATNASWEDVLDAMANDTVDSPKQFSCSWGDSSAGAPNLTAENIFKQIDAQGQSFYCAAGDGDALVGGIPFPAESTNIIQVGGTTLTTTGPGGPPIFETVWDWGGQSPLYGVNDSIGSSGGVSANFAIPPWQLGINMVANEGSTAMRNVPDVAMTADNVFIVADDGSTEQAVGGTSCAAPEWAAITALANQQAAANGKPPVGFANPAIYAAGKSASYNSDFNDITTGNNYWALSLTNFPAVPGYDLCTGWGTPAGDNLIDLLAGVSDPLGVAPGKGFVAFGPAGGGFTAKTLTFSLTNSSASSLNWSLVNTSAWLSASSSGGALAAHTAAQVTVSLNAAAYALPAGTYVGGVLFSNQASHAVRTREFVIVSGQNLVRNGDFEDLVDSAPYTEPNWVQTGGIGIFNEAPYPTYNNDFVDDGTFTGLVTGSTLLAFSGVQFFVFGTPGTIGYISEIIPTVPGQTYGVSFWLANVGGGSPTEFLVNWNTNRVYDVLNAPDSGGWSNVTLYFTATSANSLLQFGARDDNASGFIALDDVILLPLPSLNPSLSKQGPAVALTWNSAAGVQYDVQYATNLLSPNWTTLSTTTATGPTLSVTNAVGSSPVGFYRIAVP